MLSNEAYKYLDSVKLMNTDPNHRPLKYRDIVQHFKRETLEDKEKSSKYLYLYLGDAIHSETREKLVIYSALYDDEEKGIHIGDIFARPYDMFMSEVDREKYPNIKQKYRFEYVASV